MDKKEILKKLFWDRNVDIAYMLRLYLKENRNVFQETG